MPEPSTILFNYQTGVYEDVPASQVGAALAGGTHAATGTTTTTRGEGGLVTRPVEQLGAAAAQGEGSAEDIIAQRAAAERRTERLEAVSNPGQSFAEGIGEALTLGLLHGTTEIDELRREIDGGWALAGQLVGTVIGLKVPGLVSGVAKAGEKLGAGAARAILGEASTGFRGAAARGLEEASINAALMTATGFGHQITDAVVADKPFAAESIIHEAGIGAVLGFGAGWLGSTFGQLSKSSRAAVEASGVAAKESEAALLAVNDLTRSWDEALEANSRNAGVLRVLAEDGHIPSNLVRGRTDAIKNAERARDALRKLDPERALRGDAKEYQKWRSAVERYDDAIREVDDKLAPSLVERAAPYPATVRTPLPEELVPRAVVDVDAIEAAKGYQSEMKLGLDDIIRKNPELQEKFASIYGREYQYAEPLVSSIDEANLGGRVSATSDLSTNVGVRGKRGRAPEPPAPEPIGLVRQGPDTVVDARLERFKPTAEPHDTLVDPRAAERGDLPQRFGTPQKTIVDPRLERFKSTAKPGDTAVEPGPSVVEQVPPEIARAGEPVAPASSVGEEFVENAKAAASAPVSEGKKAVHDYLKNWAKEYDARPRISSRDKLDARLAEALDRIGRVGGSRLDSAGGLELSRSLGLSQPTGSLGSRLDQVWSLGQAGKFAADEARGVRTPLRKGLMGMMQRYAVHKGARGLASAAVGGATAGPVGAILGYALTSTGFAGSVASSAGKLAQQVAKVGEALLSGRRAVVAVRAAAGNRPYQYSDEGPIQDPIQRILEVQRMATNPDAIRARVNKQLGDLVVVAPEMAQHLADTTVSHIREIAMSSPAIMMTPLGTPIAPSGTAMTRFFDFENAMHDLRGTLKALASGGASESQIRAFHVGYPAVHAQLVRGVIGQSEALARLESAKLRAMERALGMPLTRASAEPGYIARLQGNWTSPQVAGRAQAPQSFKITAPAPTPVQASSSGRAPGNERKR